MTCITSGITFAVCLTLALTADGWVDKPLPALVGAGITQGIVMALAGLARGRKRPFQVSHTRNGQSGINSYGTIKFHCHYRRLWGEKSR